MCGDGYKDGLEYRTWSTLEDASFRSSLTLLPRQAHSSTKKHLVVVNDGDKERSVFNPNDLHLSRKTLAVLRKGPKCVPVQLPRYKISSCIIYWSLRNDLMFSRIRDATEFDLVQLQSKTGCSMYTSIELLHLHLRVNAVDDEGVQKTQNEGVCIG